MPADLPATLRRRGSPECKGHALASHLGAVSRRPCEGSCDQGGRRPMSTQPEQGGGRTDPGPTAIISERRKLINLAYRMLGSLTEAEDAVQEAYTRWYAMTPGQQQAIENPGAWLTTVTSRICLNMLSSARARRETYVGQWLPEPLPDPAERTGGRPADPADRVTLDESVSMAFLVVLDSMTPAERVAF